MTTDNVLVIYLSCMRNRDVAMIAMRRVIEGKRPDEIKNLALPLWFVSPSLGGLSTSGKR